MNIEIVAEAAQGFEGNLTLAKLLVKAAGKAGADAIKFQLVFADELAVPDYTWYDLFTELEMEDSSWEAVVACAREHGLKIYFDVFGMKSLDLVSRLGADGVKIHATDFFNTELVEAAIARMSKVFLSLGGIEVEELEAFLDRHCIKPDSGLCLLHGFQAEPTPVEANNLMGIASMKKRFPGYSIGFMDHSDGSTEDSQSLALMALPLGVDCIEKHISLDRVLELEDFPSALAPEQFKSFADRVRRLLPALGGGSLEKGEAERTYRAKALKVLVASRALEAGTIIQEKDVSLLRVTETAEDCVLRKEEVVGRKLVNGIGQYDQITVGAIS